MNWFDEFDFGDHIARCPICYRFVFHMFFYLHVYPSYFFFHVLKPQGRFAASLSSHMYLTYHIGLVMRQTSIDSFLFSEAF